MQITETVHHGNYRNVRLVELDDLSDDSLLAMLTDCPYKGDGIFRRLPTLRMALASGGSYSFGWSEWEVTA